VKLVIIYENYIKLGATVCNLLQYHNHQTKLEVQSVLGYRY